MSCEVVDWDVVVVWLVGSMLSCIGCDEVCGFVPLSTSLFSDVFSVAVWSVPG